MVGADSTVQYHRMSPGLVPPDPPEQMEEKQKQRQRRLRRKRQRFVNLKASTLSEMERTESTGSVHKGAQVS